MFTPAADAVAGYPSGNMAEKDASQETTLGSAYSPVDYMSITSFPRLPEDDALSGENNIKTRKEEDNFLSEQDTDPDLFLKSARLQRLPSSSSELGSQDVSPLRETHRDPLAGDCSCRQDGLTIIITACLTFATGVTVALIMQIYFGDPQIFNQGAVVTDVGHCTSVGAEVLSKHGSSVDAAIAAVLCLGIINPHMSGIGGGGVMLVHDIRKNESRVIDFQETAPSAIQEDMFQFNLEQKPGLLVGVPGMLSGMHQAHQLYGRMPWEELITIAADVARNGFNVTHDLAEAVSKVKDQNVSDSFRDIFLRDGQLLPGLFMRRLDLAAILDLIATNGISEFYSSNLTQEMVAEVQARGGVLNEEDFSNYSTVLQQPVEGLYQGHQIITTPPPHAGAALITALNILEGFNITSQVPRNSTYHWMAEALKIALALASSLGDPFYDPSVSEALSLMLSKSEAASYRQMINDSHTFSPGHYVTPFYSLEPEPASSQVVVMGSDDFIVSVISSLNQPFGSGIMTPSGILLNSQMRDFSLNTTQSSVSLPLRNSIQPGKRPLSFLTPTVVRPSLGLCGTYLSVGGSNGDRMISSIAQVIMNVLSFHKNLSDSLTFGRLHPQLQPNILLVDNEFPEEDIEALRLKDHHVERVGVLSVVQGTRRTNDLIIGVKDPRCPDASAVTTS